MRPFGLEHGFCPGGTSAAPMASSSDADSLWFEEGDPGAAGAMTFVP